MATFVLVHGAWGGAHGFRRVRPLLRAGGHEVFTPSLTGIGERAHLTGPLVYLDAFVPAAGDSLAPPPAWTSTASNRPADLARILAGLVDRPR